MFIMNYFGVFVLIFVIVDDISSTQRYAPLQNLTLLGSYQADVHSEYYIGKCQSEEKQVIYQANFTYEDIKGLTIIQGPMNITKKFKPNCMYIKATSSYDRMINYRSYEFTVCIIKIVYIYTGKLFRYYYYEWFLPAETKEDIFWQIFFYLTPKEST